MNDIKTRETEVTPLEDIRAPARGEDCVVVIYSSDQHHFGKRFVLTKEPLYLGRGSENHIVLDNDIVSRSHCRLERRTSHWYVVDQGSTNGTYVNDELVTEHRLRQGDQVKVGDTILKYLSGSDVEAQYHETIYRMTIIDGLTGVNNKRFLTDTLGREIPRARRYERPLSLLMIDIDHFKSVNDTFGHLAGDAVLKELGGLIRVRLRPDDVLGRYGGEEFAVILPETNLRGGAAIAEDLRQLVEGHAFRFEGQHIPVTISVGVAELEPKCDEIAFFKAADANLYEAKRTGRNRVCA